MKFGFGIKTAIETQEDGSVIEYRRYYTPLYFIELDSIIHERPSKEIMERPDYVPVEEINCCKVNKYLAGKYDYARLTYVYFDRTYRLLVRRGDKCFKGGWVAERFDYSEICSCIDRINWDEIEVYNAEAAPEATKEEICIDSQLRQSMPLMRGGRYPISHTSSSGSYSSSSSTIGGIITSISGGGIV